MIKKKNKKNTNTIRKKRIMKYNKMKMFLEKCKTSELYAN